MFFVLHFKDFVRLSHLVLRITQQKDKVEPVTINTTGEDPTAGEGQMPGKRKSQDLASWLLP
jgi:hypothetical protein